MTSNSPVRVHEHVKIVDVALPEMMIWWFAFPFLIHGFWYASKNRLRQVSPILLFTTMLTLAYSVFQGNVGTAYRQRSQLLVFYFIFVAVGAILLKERAEDRRLREKLAKQTLLETMAVRKHVKNESSASAEIIPAAN